MNSVSLAGKVGLQGGRSVGQACLPPHSHIDKRFLKTLRIAALFQMFITNVLAYVPLVPVLQPARLHTSKLAPTHLMTLHDVATVQVSILKLLVDPHVGSQAAVKFAS